MGNLEIIYDFDKKPILINKNNIDYIYFENNDLVLVMSSGKEFMLEKNKEIDIKGMLFSLRKVQNQLFPILK